MRTALFALALAAAVAAGPALGAPSPAPAPGKAAAKPGRPAATGVARAKPKPPVASAAARRPLTLAAQNIQGRAEGARVLFVHTGPTIALEDAPKHPSYLRDDFTAALSSPVTVHVRNLAPLRAPTTAGGTR